MNVTNDGLTRAEAQKKLAEFGPNQIAAPQSVNFWRIARAEVTEPMILLLLVVGILYSFWGKLEDGITIFTIITVLVFVEVWNEFRAKKAIAALSRMAAPRSKVMRDGQVTEVATEEIVPGDVIVLGPGTRVAADGRLVASFSVEADESALTGESQSVGKAIKDEVYAGTLVVGGEGRAEITATGKQTRFGKIAALAGQIQQPRTPLQLAMKRLVKYLVWVALFFSVAIPAIGVLQGRPLREMFLTGLALAFAVIPEEGPIIITMILGLGAYRLSKQHFLVKQLKAAEVLGDATVILTDKTGTLTENVVKIQDVYPAESEAAVMAAFGGALTEMSLTATDEAVRARMKDLRVADDLGAVLRERSFDATHKTRSVLREAAGGKLTLYMSGAPEEVLEHAAGDAAGWEAEAEKQAAQGRRVIAVAERAVAAADRDADFAKLEKGLKIVGLAALADSPRAGVKAAIARALGAGVRTIMVTGDHPQTALAIARLVGIPAGGALTGADLDKLSDKELRQTVRGTAIFSRVTPEHKYRLLQALQANGEVVAVTGDGINDTLALKGADIGIAMGIKGTDAAKEAADVVLADDNYTTIAAAIFEGRKFFDNLRKGFKYYLSVKTALVLTFLLPALTGISFPFAPVQIIVLELFMDLAASSGFVAEPAERGIYHRAPRDPKTQLFDARTIVNMLTAGVSLFAAVWLSYWYASANHLSAGQAQSFAFAAWVMGHVILAFVSRSDSEPVWRLGFFSNPVIVGWAAVAFTFVTMAVMVPGVANLLKLSTLSWTQLGTVFVIALAAIGWRELFKWFGRR